MSSLNPGESDDARETSNLIEAVRRRHLPQSLMGMSDGNPDAAFIRAALTDALIWSDGEVPELPPRKDRVKLTSALRDFEEQEVGTKFIRLGAANGMRNEVLHLDLKRVRHVSNAHSQSIRRTRREVEGG